MYRCTGRSHKGAGDEPGWNASVMRRGWTGWVVFQGWGGVLKRNLIAEYKIMGGMDRVDAAIKNVVILFWDL